MGVFVLQLDLLAGVGVGVLMAVGLIYGGLLLWGMLDDRRRR